MFANAIAVPLTAFWIMPFAALSLLLMPLMFTGSAQYPFLLIKDVLWFQVLSAIKRKLQSNGIDLPFPTHQILFHDQTEETDGDRSRQREGWPAGRGDVPQPRSIAAVLAANDVQFDTLTLVEMPFPEMAQAIQNGTVDAAWLWRAEDRVFAPQAE